MIAFGVCIGSDEKYLCHAAPQLDRARRHGHRVYEVREQRSIFQAYNSFLDRSLSEPDLEALVLLHEDVEILDDSLCARICHIFEDETVAIVGAVGARNVQSIAWWYGECRGRVMESRGLVDFGGGTHDVEVADGLFLALSPWAVHNLRFDTETFSGFHAYDADICFQARVHGRRVVVTELPLYHHTKGGFGDEVAFARADLAWQRKWHSVLAPEEGNAAGIRQILGRLSLGARWWLAPIQVRARRLYWELQQRRRENPE